MIRGDARSQVIANAPLILANDICSVLSEEVPVELVDQILLHEVLEAEGHNTVDTGTGAACGQVGVDHGGVLRVLEDVAYLVAILQKHG